MKAFASTTAFRGLCVLGAAALLIGAAGCATPAPDSDRAEANRKRQQALSEMEALGQRNDDRPLMK